MKKIQYEEEVFLRTFQAISCHDINTAIDIYFFDGSKSLAIYQKDLESVNFGDNTIEFIRSREIACKEEKGDKWQW